MKMGMGVHHAAVGMTMGVNEVCPQKQVSVGENLRWSPFGNHGACLQHENAIRDIFDDLQLMSSCDHGPGRAFPLLNEVYDLALALRIEGRGGLIEQQDFGVEDQDRGQGDPLFLATREPVGRSDLSGVKWT